MPLILTAMGNHTAWGGAPGRASRAEAAVSRGGPDIAIKRALDIGCALAGLFALFPVLLAVAALVKMTSPGPVLFRQARYGRGGVPFGVYKFRTMTGAPRSIDVIGDPRDHAARITPLGDILRRYCIDELPQLLNVLLGDMSLVGPRAHPVGMKVGGTLYETVVPGYHARHAIRPGMTGLAQVCGLAGNVGTVERARGRVIHDLIYVREGRLALDLAIILFTTWRFLVRGGRGERSFPTRWFIADATVHRNPLPEMTPWLAEHGH